MKTNKNNRQYEMEKEMKRFWQGFLFGGLPILFGFMGLAISVSLGTFIMGLTGVIVIIRKEATSGRGTIRGPMAIVLGVLLITIFWGVSAYFLWAEISVGRWKF